MESAVMRRQELGGVEEKKEEVSMDGLQSPACSTVTQRRSSIQALEPTLQNRTVLNHEIEPGAEWHTTNETTLLKHEAEADGEHYPLNQTPAQQQEPKEEGFSEQLESFARMVFGSCGSAIETASYFIQGQGFKWNNNNNNGMRGPNHCPAGEAKPALSVVEELKKLARQEGRFWGMTQRRPADIPRFLGEEAVYSFEDDNISALSQHTLEEMARKGIEVTRRSKAKSTKSIEREDTHPPPTRSTSTGSSTEQLRDERRKQRDRSIRRLEC